MPPPPPAPNASTSPVARANAVAVRRAVAKIAVSFVFMGCSCSFAVNGLRRPPSSPRHSLVAPTGHCVHDDGCWNGGYTKPAGVGERVSRPTLTALDRGLAGRVRRARTMANMSPRRWAEAVEEHEEILEALGARRKAAGQDPEAAPGEQVRDGEGGAGGAGGGVE